MRPKELAAARVRYGHRRLPGPLRREGWPVDAKRIHRLHREEGLAIRPKVPERQRAWRCRQSRPALGAADEVWAMDFMADQLFDGRPYGILTVIDGHTREALATVPRTSLRAYRVVEVLDRLAAERGRPRTLQGGTSAAELPAPRVRRQGARPMAHLNGVGSGFARPGRPTDDGLLEAFNAR